MKTKGIYYVGSGVSGGEEGARYGPSLMPGGAPEAWPHIKPIFQAIAAKSGDEPCCDWVGRIINQSFFIFFTLLWMDLQQWLLLILLHNNLF